MVGSTTDARGNTRQRQRGASAEELRRHNLSVLVDHVHLAGSASRSQLASLTGLNRSTIADLVAELSDLGLVAERRTTVATGPGRPSRVVTAQPAGAVVVAVELAVDSIAVATVGFGGHVFNRVRVDRPRGRFSPPRPSTTSPASPSRCSAPSPSRIASPESASPSSASPGRRTGSSTSPPTSVGATCRSATCWRPASASASRCRSPTRPTSAPSANTGAAPMPVSPTCCSCPARSGSGSA